MCFKNLDNFSWHLKGFNNRTKWCLSHATYFWGASKFSVQPSKNLFESVSIYRLLICTLSFYLELCTLFNTSYRWFLSKSSNMLINDSFHPYPIHLHIGEFWVILSLFYNNYQVSRFKSICSIFCKILTWINSSTLKFFFTYKCSAYHSIYQTFMFRII